MKENEGKPKEGLTWLPLGGGWTDKEKEDLEAEFGSNWRDLFNGL